VTDEHNEETASPSELEPTVSARNLPLDVANLRLLVAKEEAYKNAQLQAAIDAHIEAHAAAVEQVIVAHKAVADETDIEIGADTRWSAIWELGGRCLAICRVLLHDLRGGFASEAIGTHRALHEVAQLLAAITFHKEDETLRKWLSGEWVRAWEARAVVGRKQELALERMAELGVEPVGGDVDELGREIYDLLSKAAHHRRIGFLESYSKDLRSFAYGPHPDAGVRADHVVYAGHLIEEATWSLWTLSPT
jgi:hypothetical protein